MIPVFQTMSLANDGHGNCFNACIASILERPLREVALIHPRTAKDWHEEWRLWLADQGYRLSYHGAEDPPAGYSIASGRSGRVYPDGHQKAGERIHHACVAFDGVVVHDPFPIPGMFDQIGYYQRLVPLTDAERCAHDLRKAIGVSPETVLL